VASQTWQRPHRQPGLQGPRLLSDESDIAKRVDAVTALTSTSTVIMRRV
jgi:hypothetical protein